MINDASWNSIVDDLNEVTEQLAKNEIDVRIALGRVESYRASLDDDEMLENIQNTISEVDGFPEHFECLRLFLKGRPDKDGFEAFFR